MLLSFWSLSLLASLAHGAPTYATAAGVNPATLSVFSEYFNILSQKTKSLRNKSTLETCNMSKAVMPAAPNATALPAPSTGLTLKHVAIGRGTQNYTCATSTASSIPAAVGAIASLYNASCTSATYPTLLALLPALTLEYNLSPTQQTLFPASLLLSGHHYFSSLTTPTFDLNTANGQLGFADTAKVASTPAPSNAVKGQGGAGNGAVPWLKLQTKSGATGGLEEVYRLNTAGGAAPTTCDGMASSFEVQYAAEYWFYASS